MIQDIDNIDPKLLEEDDRIVAYLKGKMSEEEEQQFMKELKENPELKEKAIAVARLVKGLKEVGTEQDKKTQDAFLASSDEGVETAAKQAIHAITMQEKAMQEVAFQKRQEAEVSVAEEEKRSKTKKTKTFSIRRTATWLSIAASLICIIWLGLTYNNYRKTTGLGDEYADAFDTGIFVRGEESPGEAEKKLSALFQNVKDNRDLEKTIHELSLYWELSTMEVYNDYTDYSSDIGWNLAIAHLKDNNKKEAKAVFEKLISEFEEGSAVKEKAKELLEKL